MLMATKYMLSRPRAFKVVTQIVVLALVAVIFGANPSGPAFAVPTKPPTSKSYYVQSTDPADMYDLGADRAY